VVEGGSGYVAICLVCETVSTTGVRGLRLPTMDDASAFKVAYKECVTASRKIGNENGLDSELKAAFDVAPIVANLLHKGATLDDIRGWVAEVHAELDAEATNP
jgi:hypothetical protein